MRIVILLSYLVIFCLDLGTQSSIAAPQIPISCIAAQINERNAPDMYFIDAERDLVFDEDVVELIEETSPQGNGDGNGKVFSKKISVQPAFSIIAPYQTHKIANLVPELNACQHFTIHPAPVYLRNRVFRI